MRGDRDPLHGSFQIAKHNSSYSCELSCTLYFPLQHHPPCFMQRSSLFGEEYQLWSLSWRSFLQRSFIS